MTNIETFKENFRDEVMVKCLTRPISDCAKLVDDYCSEHSDIVKSWSNKADPVNRSFRTDIKLKLKDSDKLLTFEIKPELVNKE